MCCILCVCIYVITLYCIYGMFLIDYGTPVLFKSLFLKLFIKALLSRLLDTSAIEIHYYYYIVNDILIADPIGKSGHASVVNFDVDVYEDPTYREKTIL